MTNTRYFPEGSTIVRPKQFTDVEIGIYSAADKVGFIAYSGRKSKPDRYYIYRSLAERDRGIERYLKDVQAAKDRKALYASRRVLAANPCKVGDIFYSSWGYDQTNIDFYQVVKVSGSFVEVRPIGQSVVTDKWNNDMAYYVTATPDQFIGEKVLRKKVQTFDGGQSVYLTLTSYASAYQWDGQPKMSTHYA